MRQTRSSTRLANVAKKAPPNKQVPAAPDSDFGDYPSGWMGQATDDMLEETHTDDVDFEDEEEEVVVPKRKRQRTSQGAKPPARKRQVRGKQGRLEGLMKMPIDIFTEIALYLMPGDIIVLSRANKFFRSLLMHRSAIHIWHGVMRSVPGLPPCPPDMSEPRYLALIYSRHCSNCGATVTRRMDETLRVRLCPSCRDQSLVNYRDIPTEIQSLVLYSSKIVPNKRRYGYEIHCLVADVADVTAKLEELKASDSPVALERWKDDRQKLLETRRKEAADLGVFLNSIDITRDQELSDLRRQRRSDIEQRLMALGWEQNDMLFHYAMSREWTSLVDQPKPLTDRTWENLRPKLIPILEANRAARLAHEKTQRKQARRTKLDAHLSEVRAGRAPLLDVTIRTPPIPSPNAEPSTMKVVHKGIFPDLVDALEWPIMKDLLETDVPVAELDARLDEHREDIERQIDAWILDVQTRCAETLRTGREDDGLDRHAPDPTLSLEGDSAADPLAHLSSDLKLLLRADSLFEPIKTGSSTSHVYDALVLNGYRQVHDPLRPLRYSKGPLELTRVKRHQGAQAAARVLLEHLGKPDASYLEMRSGGQNYVCGRCPDNSAKSWEEIVHHYMQNRAVWDFAQKPENQLKLTELGITFNNVHDPAFNTDKPMLKIVTPIEATLAVSNMLHGGQTKVCRVCQKVGFLSEVRGREDSIIAHLLDVHGIAEPKVPEHYGSAFYGAIFTDMFDYDGSDPYGLYDSDPFDEDPWGMYGYSDDEAFLW